MEILLGNTCLLGVRTAGSRRVLGGYRQILGWSSACSGRFLAESRRVHGRFFVVFSRFSMYLQRALGDSRLGWY